MAGDGQEAQLARSASLAAAVGRAGLATASFALAAAARAAFAMAVVVLVAVAVIGTGGAAGAADLPQLPASTTTLPAAAVPAVPSPEAVPPATIPKVTVPSIPVTATAPELNLEPSGGPAGGPVATVPAGGVSGPARITESLNPSTPGSTVATADGGRSRVGTPTTGPAARRADPAVEALNFRLRRAAVETVQQLTFPLALAMTMLAFLVFQHRVDKNDPRMVAPAESGDDDLLRFS